MFIQGLSSYGKLTTAMNVNLFFVTDNKYFMKENNKYDVHISEIKI